MNNETTENTRTKERRNEERYDTAVSKHEEYKEIWKSFPVTPEGEQEKKAFSIRTGYNPSQRPKTPAMKAFEELRGIWTVYGEWPDSMEEKRYRETILLSPDGPEWAFHASVLDGQAWPEAESIIATDAWWAFEYAQDVVGCGNETIERGIMNDAYYTYLYARFVVKGRFERRGCHLARSTCKSVLCAKGPCSSICQGRSGYFRYGIRRWSTSFFCKYGG